MKWGVVPALIFQTGAGPKDKGKGNVVDGSAKFAKERSSGHTKKKPPPVIPEDPEGGSDRDVAPLIRK